MAGHRFRVQFPAQAEHVPRIRQLVIRHLRRLGCTDEGRLDAVKLGVTEASMNVVHHAYRTSSRTGDIEVEVTPAGDHVNVVVRDDGSGPAPATGSTRTGLGVRLMSAIADGFEMVERESGGTEVRLTFIFR